ncbi:hypothetical protein [Alitabrizicola rongguiensis]|nr:hypothetical protein [Tabrizicola rongguiensis]
MLNDVKETLANSSRTLIEDALGVVTLFGLLLAALNLPVFS